MDRLDSAARRGGWACALPLHRRSAPWSPLLGTQVTRATTTTIATGRELWNMLRKARVIDLSAHLGQELADRVGEPALSRSRWPPRMRTPGAPSATTASCPSPRRSCNGAASTERPASMRSATSGATASSSGACDAAAATSDLEGLGASGVGAHLAIDKFPNDLMVNRGVLLDVARMVQRRLDPVAAGLRDHGPGTSRTQLGSNGSSCVQGRHGVHPNRLGCLLRRAAGALCGASSPGPASTRPSS